MSTTPLIDSLVERRVKDPRGFQARVIDRERPRWHGGEPLMVIAADHPARGALRVGADEYAMADRESLLERCVTALSRPGVNGFLGTSDMVQDLANLGALEGKVVFGSMNRGGLRGASFEIDDRMTGYDVDGVIGQDLAGGKMLMRYDFEDSSTSDTVAACASSIDALARAGRIAMVEPFISRRDATGKLVNDLSTQAVVKSVAMTAGLAADSTWTWLKLPAVEGMEEVARASSMPILLLGGELSDDVEATRRMWARALAPSTVQGLVLGRSMLYPADGDVASAVDNAVTLLEV